jgi:Protein of unknown function (DUF4232)
MQRHAGLTALLVLVLGCSLTSCGQRRSPEIAAQQTKPVHSARVSGTSHSSSERPPQPSQTTPSPALPARCQPERMRLAVALTESVMSQPFADISITNTGKHACALIGYPRIAVAGHRGFPDQSAPVAPVGITVRHRIYERVDPGPHPVLVRPQHRVFFSIGTADAYEGPLLTLTRLTVTLPGTRSSELLPINLLANGPPGAEIPIGITAIVASPHA